MKYLILALSLGFGLAATMIAKAQFTFTLTNSNITVAPGGLATFGATLSNSSTSEQIFLDQIGISLTNTALTTWEDGGTLFNSNFPLFLETSPDPNSSKTASLFAIRLSGSAPTNGASYTGNVTVNYRVGNNPEPFQLTNGFSVTATPTPPVVLVTLLSGIGTVRMALRRRKSQA